MKNILSFAMVLIFSQGLFAQGLPKFKVLERKENSNRTVYNQVQLADLESVDSFDGKYFKIVMGKEDKAIPFNSTDGALLLKAATVYHHLTKARTFWINELGSEMPQTLEKMTIRLDIKNLFDEQGQFANDNRQPQFNNALSIPEGESPSWVPASKQRKWSKEIWFRPMKKIETKDLPGIGPNPVTQALEVLEQPFLNYTQNQFNQAMMEHLFYPTYAANPLWVDVVRFVGTIAMTKAIIEASKHIDRLFMDKYYYLDTALVPEVIYHEYSHIILSDSLKMTHSTPVVEGMADYFAAVISHKTKVYANVKGRSNAAGKNARNNKTYSHWYESNRAATSDFVLSVLWDVREVLGAKVGDQLVYEARTKLDTQKSTINGDLIQAVLDSCDVKCESPRRDKLKLYETFSLKGF